MEEGGAGRQGERGGRGRKVVKVGWRDGRRVEEGRWGRAVRKDLRCWGGETGADGKCEGGRGEGGRRGRVEEGREELEEGRRKRIKGSWTWGGGRRKEEGVGKEVGGGGGEGGCMQIMRHFARISPQNKPGPVFSTARVM
jgi:hypothetical protein